ncbi:ferrous iron transport protein A [bacterium]|jgi:Fe2+ transport system protein FeoA|nr:ferrous iron transport protein A [bacterium]
MSDAIFQNLNMPIYAEKSSTQESLSEGTALLSELGVGVSGNILSLDHDNPNGEDQSLTKRFMRLGFLKGESVKLLHRAPLFQGPFLVEVRGARIALSGEEAKKIQLEVLPAA